MAKKSVPAPVVRMAKVADLVPYVNNPREHPEEQISTLAAAIKEFGFLSPIVTDGEDGLLAGHGRLLAAQKLKLDEVPVIEASHLTPAQRKAYILADNKIAEQSTWNEDLLRIEFEELRGLEYDLSLTGFDFDEIDGLVSGDAAAPSDDSDSVPAVAEHSVSRVGDVWSMGDHRLLCGDSGNPDDVALVLQGDLVDQLMTDPPYGVAYGDKSGRKDIANDNLESYEEFFFKFLSNIPFATYNTVYIFMSSLELHTLRAASERAGIYWSDWLVWVKNRLVLGRKDYNSIIEHVFYGWKGRHKFYGPTNAVSALEFDRPNKSDLHPTMKPVPLIAKLVSDGTKRGAVVYEPFGGSGSTLIACEETGRRCRAIEIDPLYVDVICRRWQNLTGLQAVRQDGVLFDDLAAEMS